MTSKHTNRIDFQRTKSDRIFQIKIGLSILGKALGTGLYNSAINQINSWPGACWDLGGKIGIKQV
jgi:hypothetical protein